MNKNKGFPLPWGGVRGGLLLLLMLLPLCGFCQTLTQYEYWFDDDFAGRQTFGLSGKEKDVTATIDTYFLETGMHRLSLRVKQSDGHYSAITTSWFLKLTTGEAKYLEYWFDGDYENAKRFEGHLAASGDAYVFNCDVDVSGLSVGNHQLYYRAVSDDGLVSTSVSVSPFLKLVTGEAKWLEYWFDGDRANAKRFEGHLAASGDAYVFNCDVDVSGLSVGNHQLYYRAVSDDGLVSTSVSVSPFLKLVTGEAKWLEYWFDGDRANMKRIAGNKASDGNGYVFNNELDVAGLDPGHHRLYYRAVSDDGRVSTSVSTSSVVVKLLAEMNSVSDAVVTNFSVSVDGDTRISAPVDRIDAIANINRNIDLRDLSVGEHNLKLKVWNSKRGSVTLDTIFQVTEPEPPVIQLTANESGGLVYLRFNAIPNDVAWRLERTDANGVVSTVRVAKENNYPETIYVVDDPANGTYTYQAKVFYTDSEGKRVSLPEVSNSVNVTMTNASQVRYGTISGIVKVTEGIGTEHSWVVSYSDHVESDKIDKWGTFVRARVPVGTVIDITAIDKGGEGFEFDKKTIVVKEGRNDVVITGKVNVEKLRNSYDKDLAFASRMDFTPGQYMKVKVKNISGKTWNGKIKLLSVKKTHIDKDIDPLGIAGSGQTEVGAGSVLPQMASFSMYADYDVAYSERFSLAKNGEKEIHLPHNLKSMRGDEDEMYYFFVYSVDDNKKESIVAVNRDYNIKENPIMQLVEKNMMAAAEQQVLEEDIEYAVNIILSMMKNTKELDERLGSLEKGYTFLKSTMEDEVIDYALRCNSFEKLKERYPKDGVMNIVYETDLAYLDIVHSIRDSIASLVRTSGDILGVIKDAKKALDFIKIVENAWNNYNDLERAAFVAQKILDLSNAPFTPILQTYLDITKTTVNNILYLTEKYDKLYNFRDFYENKYIFQIRVEQGHRNWLSLNDWIINGENWGPYFLPSEVAHKIDKVEVYCDANLTNDGSMKVRGKATYKAVKEVPPTAFSLLPHCYLERIIYEGDQGNAVSSDLYYAINDMRMTIYWTNGRISHIPIRNGGGMRGDGVKYDSLSKQYTITFLSKSSDPSHMADIIKLNDNP